METTRAAKEAAALELLKTQLLWRLLSESVLVEEAWPRDLTGERYVWVTPGRPQPSGPVEVEESILEFPPSQARPIPTWAETTGA